MNSFITLPELWVHRYLEHLSYYGDKSAAAREAGTTLETVGEYRKLSGDFKLEEVDAVEAFKFRIHKALIDQGLLGTPTIKNKYIVDQNGEKVLKSVEETITKDSKLLTDLAKTHVDAYKDIDEKRDIVIYFDTNDPHKPVDNGECVINLDKNNYKNVKQE